MKDDELKIKLESTVNVNVKTMGELIALRFESYSADKNEINFFMEKETASELVNALIFCIEKIRKLN